MCISFFVVEWLAVNCLLFCAILRTLFDVWGCVCVVVVHVSCCLAIL